MAPTSSATMCSAGFSLVSKGTGDQRVLKGNAFHKGYFPTTRFSDDLDLAASGRIDNKHLLEVLNNVCRMCRRAAA
jgi:predicted nucleotidyltransferase component of viral defense system